MPEEDRHKQLVMLPMPADRDLLQIKKNPTVTTEATSLSIAIELLAYMAN